MDPDDPAFSMAGDAIQSQQRAARSHGPEKPSCGREHPMSTTEAFDWWMWCDPFSPATGTPSRRPWLLNGGGTGLVPDEHAVTDPERRPRAGGTRIRQHDQQRAVAPSIAKGRSKISSNSPHSASIVPSTLASGAGDADDLMTVKEAAAFLKTSKKTIGRRVQAGELPCYRLGEGGARRFWARHLRALLVLDRSTSSQTPQLISFIRKQQSRGSR